MLHGQKRTVPRGCEEEIKEKLIPFSAFWLRSSVVSVLISLISDMWAIGSHDIKFIFLGGRSIKAACCL
ncbi:hypothetical protein MIMGU_mgv1a018612mg, partial [Erythranthe guttata]